MGDRIKSESLTGSPRNAHDNHGERFGGLEILRASPLKRRQSDFLRHLDRLDALREFGLRLTPPKGVPATQLERLARVARRSKPSAIAALKEPRRTATVAALFYTLEASAQDDATELGEALISDLFQDAEQAQATDRAAHQRDLDKAALLLRNLAGMLISDGDMPFEAWRDTVYARWPKNSIEGAMTTIDSLVQPAASKPHNELNARWRRARKLFFNIATRIDLAASPGGVGRLIKTLHILNYYIDDAEFRRRILVQLNRQEFCHKLARKIYHGDRGEMRNALRQGQEEQLGALGVALNAVIHWNAIYTRIPQVNL